MAFSVARLDEPCDPITRDPAELERREDEMLDELYERELQRYARQVWETQRVGGDSVLKRIARLAELCERIERRGPTEHCERELKLDACLSTWGAAHTMKMLCLAADGKLS